MRIQVFSALLFGCLAAGGVYAQPPEAAGPKQTAIDEVDVSSRSLAGPKADFLAKLRSIRVRLEKDYAKRQAAKPEKALAFRKRAVESAIKFHNLVHKKSKIPMLDDIQMEIQRLIYEHPRISAHIFADELEISESAEAYDYKAQAESVYGDNDKALADWTAAIKLSPGAEVLRHRGHYYLRTRQYDKAIEDFSGAIKAGDTAPSYNSRAYAYFLKDDYAAAAEDMEQFFKLNTDKDFAASVARSRVCKGLGRHGFSVAGCVNPGVEDKK